MLESLSRIQKIIFFILLTIMLIVIIYYIYSTLYKEDFTFSYASNNIIENILVENTDNLNTFNSESSNNSDNLENNYIVIYICGEVEENKVVTLKENSRICDAIEAAGGLTVNADLTNINLAYILEDGEKIYIPKIGEINQEASISSQNSSNNSISNNKININKATQTELETIPGVGPSTAIKIINYREENGKFSSIEDIKNVSGIGDKKYENIKDYISVK